MCLVACGGVVIAVPGEIIALGGVGVARGAGVDGESAVFCLVGAGGGVVAGGGDGEIEYSGNGGCAFYLSADAVVGHACGKACDGD